MDVCDRAKKTWENLLNSTDLTSVCDRDDDFQGLFILLQVLNSCVKRFADRCRDAENSLIASAEECSRLDLKCSELQKALLSEKAKECSLCQGFKCQLESLKSTLAEKSKPCSQCFKLLIEMKNQRKAYKENRERFKKAFSKFLESGPFSEENCYTALNYVSQMIPLDEDDADTFDSESIFQQKIVADSPKRKSPCYDKELDPGSRKRKSPCIESEPSASHVLLPKSITSEESNVTKKSSSEKKFPTDKAKAKAITKVNTETQRIEEQYKIVVPETLPDERIIPNKMEQNIVIPETFNPQDDYTTSLPDDCRTPEGQLMERDEDASPALSATKKSVKSTGHRAEMMEMKTVENEIVSPSMAHRNANSPSVLAMHGNTSVQPCRQTEDLKVSDAFFDKIDKSTAGNPRSSIASTNPSRNSEAERFIPKVDPLCPQGKAALGEKNIWALKKTVGVEEEKINADKICPRKMKQTTLAVIVVPKNQDISHNDSFNGGVLSEVENDEHFDSDDSECLILPSPKSNTSIPRSSKSGANSRRPDAESNPVEGRTGTVASLEETYYFAPPITSTCLSLSRRNRPASEEKDKKARKDKAKIQGLDSSFDLVPSKKNASPEYKYKEDPVRKKDERQQLPGWDCCNCKKYYAMDGKEVDDPQRHMNMCSRHRSKYKDLNVTVKGFWDPCIPETQD